MQLITYQLIEEYQLELDFAESQLKLQSLDGKQDPILQNSIACLKRVIEDLKVKQSEERENIIFAFSWAITYGFIYGKSNMESAEEYFDMIFNPELKLQDQQDQADGRN